MKKTLFPLSVVALLLSLSIFNFVNIVGAMGKPPAETPVTSTIDGLGVDALPTLRIQSDQLGSYQNSRSLVSYIQAYLGDWELDMLNLNSSPQRTVLIDLRDPVPGSAPNGSNPIAPFAYQRVRARFIAKCSQYGVDLRTMAAGAMNYCPLAIAFDASGVRYRLTMHANNFPEVNLVQVTCLANANSKCTQWKMEPSVTQLDGERKNVTKLLKVATKGNQPDQDMGDFYLSFAFHLTSP